MVKTENDMVGLFDIGDDRDNKRSLTPSQRKILYKNAKGRCQNPACKRKIAFDVMVVGHKTAWSKGGSTTLRNCVCLCMECNKRQGTYNWGRFLKKQGVEEPKTKRKRLLQKLTVPQLKRLAAKHKIKLQSQTVGDFWGTHRLAPTKTQYVNKLSGLITETEITSVPKIKVVKKRRRNYTSNWFGF
jgi:hypothetical protein